MKNKYIILGLILAVIYTFGGLAHAESGKSEDHIKVGVEANGNSGKGSLSVHSTSSISDDEDEDNDNNEDVNDDDNATTTDDEDSDHEMSEEHGSVVSAFVHSLLSVADREGGIGPQVREIAKNQNDSGTTTEEAIVKVEDRSKIKTLFLGSDYKNLGVIRSELATTTNNIEKLKKLLDKATIDADKEELNSQIDALEEQKSKLSDFVSEHENVFSLFGWFVKFFQK